MALDSVDLQIPATPSGLRVGFFGDRGSFSNLVAERRFGEDASCRPYPLMGELIEDAKGDRIDCSVIPIENSVGGWVADILDLVLSEEFSEAGLRVLEETRLHIELALVGHCNLDDAQRICSHRYPLRFARQWLHRARPDIEIFEVHNTAEAVEHAANDHHTLALAHRAAAEHRQVPVVLQTLPIDAPNATRFFVVGKKPITAAPPTRTAFCFAASHQPGSLYGILGVIAQHRLNLCRLHSHAVDHHLESYHFFAEVEADAESLEMKNALAEIRPLTSRLEILGAFRVIEI
jgi:prephenate dehydratase